MIKTLLRYLQYSCGSVHEIKNQRDPPILPLTTPQKTNRLFPIALAYIPTNSCTAFYNTQAGIVGKRQTDRVKSFVIFDIWEL